MAGKVIMKTLTAVATSDASLALEARRVVPAAIAGGGSVEIASTTPLPPTAPAERGQWIDDEAFILAWAGTAAGLGGLLGGRAWGVASAVIGGMYAAIKVNRRS